MPGVHKVFQPDRRELRSANQFQWRRQVKNGVGSPVAQLWKFSQHLISMLPIFSITALEQAEPALGYLDWFVVDDDCLHI
jgi:hypothetical protein